MARLTKKKKLVVITAALVLTGGAAFAYWTTTGTGSGTAATGTSAGITVNQTSVITDLHPGQTPVTLAGDFTNTNSGPSYVTAVTATGYTIDATHVTAGCTVAGGHYTLGGTAPVAADVPVGANQGAWTGLTITMNNLATNQDFCKGATVTIAYASN